MKASELIEKLRELTSTYGDLEVDVEVNVDTAGNWCSRECADVALQINHVTQAVMKFSVVGEDQYD